METFYKDKKVLITGAASGIGEDLAITLLHFGAKLALVDIRLILNETLRGEEILRFEADVTDSSRMVQVKEKVLQLWGGIDIVIAAAGVGGINPAQLFSTSLDIKTMSINYFGTVNTLVPFIERMKQQGSGQLVGISSLAAFRGLPQAASYSASKAAQMTMLESLRIDLRKTGIQVTCIHPGFVDTAMANHDEFQTPFKVSPRTSTQCILKAIYRKRRQYSYPWPMAILSHINRVLPNCLYDFLLPRLSPSKGSGPKLFIKDK